MKLRAFFSLALALLLLRPSAGPANEKIVLAYSGVGSGEEVHHFAKEAGIFKKYGLDVEIVYIPGGSTVVQAMISGGVHFGRGSATEVVSAHLGGFQLKILAALINKFVYSFVTSTGVAKQGQSRGGQPFWLGLGFYHSLGVKILGPGSD
ncbi:MAG: ABC transporter substrate-binding protein [Deltaproteobacteria bacterium]|nr:ABC transporter substrate-binding protein [Deltaproteobacteria bacterium]